jgi:hypothetical protein
MSSSLAPGFTGRASLCVFWPIIPARHKVSSKRRRSTCLLCFRPLSIWGGIAMADLTKKLKTYWFYHRTDLPPWISSGIGQTAAEWSVLERELEEIIRILTNGETQQTRILTNRMNVRSREATVKALIAHLPTDCRRRPKTQGFRQELGTRSRPSRQGQVRILWRAASSSSPA